MVFYIWLWTNQPFSELWDHFLQTFHFPWIYLCPLKKETKNQLTDGGTVIWVERWLTKLLDETGFAAVGVTDENYSINSIILGHSFYNSDDELNLEVSYKTAVYVFTFQLLKPASQVSRSDVSKTRVKLDSLVLFKFQMTSNLMVRNWAPNNLELVFIHSQNIIFDSQ